VSQFVGACGSRKRFGTWRRSIKILGKVYSCTSLPVQALDVEIVVSDVELSSRAGENLPSREWGSADYGEIKIEVDDLYSTNHENRVQLIDD
jgi:hypothetical protein